MTITIPPAIKNALNRGAMLLVSLSGGKDSDAMLTELAALAERHGWSSQLVAVHADLGRAEWSITSSYVKHVAERYNIPLHITRRPQGDLFDEIWDRHQKRPNAPPFPSPAARYCTSDHKRAQIDTLIRALCKSGELVCATGLRAEESPARAKRPDYERREQICTKSRTVYDWYPILRYKLEDVWLTNGYTLDEVNQVRLQVQQLRQSGVDPYDAVGRAGWDRHPAYAFGNERLSCAICILASLGDIKNGIEFNPDAYRELVRIERASGYSFKKNLRLEELRPDLLENL